MSQDPRWAGSRGTREKVTVTLAPCPFCGDADPEVDEVSPKVFAVSCVICSALGPYPDKGRQSDEVARKRWNERRAK